MMLSDVFYVYAYLRLDGTPYYVGKGHGVRAYSRQHNVTVPNTDRIVFLETNLTELGALALERRYIRWYGRKNNNTGILRNLTDGGEGVVGYKHTEEAKLLMSKAATGRKHSVITKQKISQIRLGQSKPPRSVEHRQKISEFNSGRARTEEHKRKISESLKGRTRTEEHSRKISEAKRRNKIK